jgi:hypothetical protein
LLWPPSFARRPLAVPAARSPGHEADAVGHAAIVELAQAVGCERRSTSVSHQPLASHIVVAGDPHRSVDVEAPAVGAEAALSSRLEREIDCPVGLAGGVEPLVAAAGHGPARQAVGRGLALQVVRQGGRTAVFEVAAPAQPPNGAAVHALGDHLELTAAGSRCGDEVEGSELRRRSRDEHAVEHADVVVGVEVERAAGAMGEADGTGVGGAELGGPTQVPEDLLGEDSPGGREHLRLAGGEQPQLEGQRQDPLANRDVGQDAVDQLRCGVRHAAGGAAGADTAPAAGERHQELVPAVVAAAAHEAVLESAALQERAERLDDVAGQRLGVAVGG